MSSQVPGQPKRRRNQGGEGLVYHELLGWRSAGATETTKPLSQEETLRLCLPLRVQSTVIEAGTQKDLVKEYQDYTRLGGELLQTFVTTNDWDKWMETIEGIRTELNEHHLVTQINTVYDLTVDERWGLQGRLLTPVLESLPHETPAKARDNIVSGNKFASIIRLPMTYPQLTGLLDVDNEWGMDILLDRNIRPYLFLQCGGEHEVVKSRKGHIGYQEVAYTKNNLLNIANISGHSHPRYGDPDPSEGDYPGVADIPVFVIHYSPTVKRLSLSVKQPKESDFEKISEDRVRNETKKLYLIN
jgi:hypothetical protein